MKAGAVWILLALLVSGWLACFLQDNQAGLRGLYFGSYLWLHVGLGCCSLIFIGDLTGGRWNERLIPFLGAGRFLIPWSLPLFLLSLLWPGAIYPWIEHPPHSELTEGFTKADYLSRGFFTVRMLSYGLVFLALTWMSGRSAARIRARGRGISASSSPWSSAGIVIYAFIGLFFATDAVMSLEQEWFSSGYPVILMTSQNFAAYALALALWCMVSKQAEAPRWFGNLLIAMMMFWLYVTFMQFLIIWMGNMSEDITYYLSRSSPGWILLSVFLAIFSFAVPFALLLSSRIKQNRIALGAIAVFLFLGQGLFLVWELLPSWNGGVLTLLCSGLSAGAMGSFTFLYVLAPARKEVPE